MDEPELGAILRQIHTATYALPENEQLAAIQKMLCDVKTDDIRIGVEMLVIQSFRSGKAIAGFVPVHVVNNNSNNATVTSSGNATVETNLQDNGDSSRATLRAAWIGAVGVIIAAIITAILAERHTAHSAQPTPPPPASTTAPSHHVPPRPK